ncbi:hypothetical protein Busp01_52000 [Trinickia caryophylli]|nr:hypothetical protein C0Z17_21205 [Trinickia caryophylli]GLU35358.1 hypothetical protein Busp01_52000 [Trinickia caryophylli]
MHSVLLHAWIDAAAAEPDAGAPVRHPQPDMDSELRIVAAYTVKTVSGSGEKKEGATDDGGRRAALAARQY